MRKLYLVLMVFYCSIIVAQNSLVKKWDKRFGGTGNDYFQSFQQTADGGYILGGYSYSGISGDKTQSDWDPTLYFADYWIIKIDSFGNKEWDKRFGGINFEELRSLQQTLDGGYILGGYSASGISGDKTQPNWGVGNDYWIVKTDSSGNKLWDKRFGGTVNEGFNSVEQTHDGGYILGGHSPSDSSGDKTQPAWGGSADFWMVKIDSIGNKQWDKRFGGTSSDYDGYAKQTTDGGYIIGGRSQSSNNGDRTQINWEPIHPYGMDYWVVKTDSIGNKQWDYRFGGIGRDNLTSFQQTKDGGYILGGGSSSTGGDKTQPPWSAGSDDYWMVKIDSLGNKEWDKRLGGTSSDAGTSISQTLDGGYLMVGQSSSNISGDKSENNLGQIQPWVVKTDSAGNKQWDKTIFTLRDGSFPAIQSKEGCYVIASSTNGGIGGYKTQANWDTATVNPTYDYWIIKFCDSVPTVITGINNIGKDIVSLYPNPASESVTISIDESMIGSTATISDITGRKMAAVNLTTQYSLLNTAPFANGVYFVTVTSTEGRSATKKLVIRK